MKRAAGILAVMMLAVMAGGAYTPPREGDDFPRHEETCSGYDMVSSMAVDFIVDGSVMYVRREMNSECGGCVQRVLLAYQCGSGDACAARDALQSTKDYYTTYAAWCSYPRVDVDYTELPLAGTFHVKHGAASSARLP